MCVWGHERVAGEVGLHQLFIALLSFYPTHNDKGCQKVENIMHHQHDDNNDDDDDDDYDDDDDDNDNDDDDVDDDDDEEYL